MKTTQSNDVQEFRNDAVDNAAAQSPGGAGGNALGITAVDSGTCNPAFEPDEDCNSRAGSSVFRSSDHVSLTIVPDLKNEKSQGERRSSTTEKSLSKALSDFGDGTKKSKKAAAKPAVGVLGLFRYTTFNERIMLVVGVITAVVSTLCMPVLIVLFGNITKEFVNNEIFMKNQEKSPFSDTDVVTNDTLSSSEDSGSGGLFDHLIFFGVATAIFWLVQLVCIYAYVACFNIVGEKLTYRIRTQLLRMTLSQEMSWYDLRSRDGFASKTSEDLLNFQEGVSEKFGHALYAVFTFVSCVITAFYYGWELTLVNLSVVPLIGLSNAITYKVYVVFARKSAIQYSKAGSVAQEVLSNISTVFAFGGEAKEVKRYEALLEPARAAGVRENLFTSCGYGCMWFVIFSSFSLAFWYGIGLVFESRVSGGHYDAAVLMVVFFNVMMGTLSLGNSAVPFEVIASARVAAVDIFEILTRKSKLDPTSKEGLKPQVVNGFIEFRDVKFEYPSRSDVPVLCGLSLQVRPGQTVALVGSSGCGKSTCVQLLQRFYDPRQGSVTLDSVDLRELNIGWLRDQIGVVGQEPVLFDTTIEENIRYGREGLSFDEIVAAAKQANAHDFIMKLPQQYQTQVGNCGTQMSGGQKQRLAIARVLVRQPKILLLDEATSALDNRSEAIVQAALDQVSQGRTTIIVAHRLSTIRSADVIVALRAGKAEEMGTHEELMAKRGLYHSLVNAQIRSDEEQSAADSTEEEADETSTEDSGDLRTEGANEQDLRARRHSRTSTLGDETSPASPNSEMDTHSEELSSSLVWKLVKMCKKEWFFISLGTVGIVITGSLYPIFAVVMGDVLGTLAVTDPDEATRLANRHALVFLAIAIVALFAFFSEKFFVACAGLTLTMKVRSRTFEAMLRQDKGWFDMRENAVGSLCSSLSVDAVNVGEMTGRQLGTLMQAGVVMVLSFALVVYLDWRLGLIASPFVPMVVYIINMGVRLELKQSVKETSALKSANRIAVEAISNVRTVASLHTEERFCAAYAAALLPPHLSSLRKAHLRGLLFGVARTVPFVAHSIVLGLGGIFVNEGSMQYADVFKVAEALIFCSAMVGQTISFTPSFTKGKAAAARIFKLLERVSAVDSSPTAGEKLTEKLEDVRLHDVHFRYPNREDAKILQGLSLTVQKGKTLALVGPSGCGKSTVISLIERFYDPEKGKLTFNENDLCKLNVHSARQKVGLVSQEPLLFDRTIAENIAYGDNSRDVPFGEIVAAAQQANISSFIESLPEKYNTRVGSRGTQLSGGQKQRIAIARALVRNPCLLMLDEATSALDSKSEEVVQEALEKAQANRTSIIIAHRLSTIQGADTIAVINNGKLVESGTHAQLMSQGGQYASLYRANL